MQFASIVSACRRELNSHNLAEPRRENHADRHAGYRASPVREQFEREVVSYSYRSRIQTYGTRKENDLAPQHQIEPPNCVGNADFQLVRRAAAASNTAVEHCRQQRRYEYTACQAQQRGAGGDWCTPPGVTGASQAHLQRTAGAAPLPNPSLKRSANGRPPGPVWWYAVHFHQSGPGVLPSSPA